MLFSPNTNLTKSYSRVSRERTSTFPSFSQRWSYVIASNIVVVHAPDGWREGMSCFSYRGVISKNMYLHMTDVQFYMSLEKHPKLGLSEGRRARVLRYVVTTPQV